MAFCPPLKCFVPFRAYNPRNVYRDHRLAKNVYENGFILWPKTRREFRKLTFCFRAVVFRNAKCKLYRSISNGTSVTTQKSEFIKNETNTG